LPTGKEGGGSKGILKENGLYRKKENKKLSPLGEVDTICSGKKEESISEEILYLVRSKGIRAEEDLIFHKGRRKTTKRTKFRDVSFERIGGGL